MLDSENLKLNIDYSYNPFLPTYSDLGNYIALRNGVYNNSYLEPNDLLGRTQGGINSGGILNTNLSSNLKLPSLASKGIQQATKFNGSFIGKNAGAVGVAADIASNILGDKSEYSGTKGNLARGLDTGYDMLSDAAQAIPVYGTAISAGLKVAGLGNQVMGKLGGGTDGMTTLDAVLGSKLFNLGGLNPISMVNGFLGRRSHAVGLQDWRNQQRINYTAQGYSQDEKEQQKARENSNKKFGLFSRGKRHKMNDFIDEETQDLADRVSIYDQALLGNIRSQLQTSINNQGYMNRINGGLQPVSVGKQGMKLLSSVNSIQIGKQGMKLLSLYE